MKLRPFLVALIIMLAGAMGIIAWYKIIAVGDPPPSHIKEKFPSVTEPVETEPKPQAPALILKVNQKNAMISSLSCDDADVRVWQNGMRVKLSGRVYYQKPLQFRLLISSVLGSELDLGSNQDVFWYWSRRNQREGLFYAKHEDFYSTRLKTPFNPKFLSASFGIDELPTENAKFVENENGILVITESKNSMGRKVDRLTFVSKSNERIEGYLVSYDDGTKSASAEILEYSGDVPKKILFTYYEEDKIMSIEMDNIQSNVSISASRFVMPDIRPQINMAEQAGAAVQYPE